MPEEKVPEGVEITEPIIAQGEVKFMTKSAFTNPAPEKLKRIIKALNYFCVGLVTVVGATDLFTGKQSKIIVFVIGVFVLFLGSMEVAIGVKPAEDK